MDAPLLCYMLCLSFSDLNIKKVGNLPDSDCWFCAHDAIFYWQKLVAHFLSPVDLGIPNTLQNIAGMDTRQGTPLDGENVLDIIKGKVTERDWEFFSYFSFWLSSSKRKEDNRVHTHELTSVNTNEWKMVRIGPRGVDVNSLYDDAELFLFKIQRDPYEKNNVAEQHPDIVRDFLEKIRKFRSLQPKELKNVLLDTPKEREN